MTEQFGPSYASVYDTLYGEKDYEAECDLIEEAGRRFGARPIHRILDLGCGTGGHALPLTRRGYAVVGVDRSEEMLAEARRKAALAGLETRFMRGDLRTVRVGERFDLVAMMFAVLGYQLSDDDVAALYPFAEHGGGELAQFIDPREAAAGSDVLYTDVWTSMGQEAEREVRLRDLAGYAIDGGLLAAAAPDAIVLHCLPAHRGEEITDDVLEGPRSRVWVQAAHRRTAMRGVFRWVSGEGPER